MGSSDHATSNRVLFSIRDVTLFSVPPVSTVQDRPGPGREEDWKAPGEADETHGGQRDAQRCHGDGLRCSWPPETGHLDWVGANYLVGSTVHPEKKKDGGTNGQLWAQMVDMAANMEFILAEMWWYILYILSLLGFMFLHLFKKCHDDHKAYLSLAFESHLWLNSWTVIRSSWCCLINSCTLALFLFVFQYEEWRKRSEDWRCCMSMFWFVHISCWGSWLKRDPLSFIFLSAARCSSHLEPHAMRTNAVSSCGNTFTLHVH